MSDERFHPGHAGRGMIDMRFVLPATLAAFAGAGGSSARAQTGVCFNNVKMRCDQPALIPSCSHTAWQTYASRLRAVERLWARADAMSAAAVAAFDEDVAAGSEGVGLGSTLLGNEVRAPGLVGHPLEPTDPALRAHDIVETARRANWDQFATLQQQLASIVKDGRAGSAGGDRAAAATHLGDASSRASSVHDATSRLGGALGAQTVVLDSADALWAKLLAAAATAMLRENACADDRQRLRVDGVRRQRAAADIQDVKERALSPGGTIGSQWVSGNRTYANWTTAVAAAKQLLAEDVGVARHVCSSCLTSDTVDRTAPHPASLSADTAQQILAMLTSVAPDLQAAWVALAHLVDGYVDVRSQIHRWQLTVAHPRR